MPLRAWPKADFSPPEKDCWEFEVPWWLNDYGGKPLPSWSKRTLSLNQVTIRPVDGMPLKLRREGNGKFNFVAAFEPSPAEISITQSDVSPSDLRFTFSPKPLTDKVLAKLRSDIQELKKMEQELIRVADPSDPEFKKFVADVRDLEKAAEQEDLRKKSIQSILTARLEALITGSAAPN